MTDDIIEEAAQFAAERHTATERKRADFRRKFPDLAEHVDRLAALYGPGRVKVVGAVNAEGDEVGKVTDDMRERACELHAEGSK